MKNIKPILILTLTIFLTSCGTTQQESSSSVSSEIQYPLSSMIGSEGILTDFDEGFVGAVIIPSEFNGEQLVTIAANTFDNCAEITSVILPDTIQYVGSSAFSGCTNLVSVTLPDGLIEIEDNTFAGCTSLVELIIPESVNDIAERAFYNCASLVSINIPVGVLDIGTGQRVFGNCTSLTSIYIPSTVSEVGSSLFDGCSMVINIQATEAYVSANWHVSWASGLVSPPSVINYAVPPTP